MLLIADSGSTKTDWRLVDDAGTTMANVVTEGLNPYFISQKQIASVIEEQVLPIANGVEKIFFYGAGCGLPVKAAQVREVLDATIVSKYPADVAGDILGAARSLLQDAEGIACILGTGANSCFYNGHEITDVMPSLGYMFSDWGSGTVMSKDFIALLLQERLPSAIIEDFHTTYQIGRAQILDHVYNQPLPNKFLASFTPFLLKYSMLPELKRIILDNFNKFFTYYVMRYSFHRRQIKVSFTGSIAYNFQTDLRDTAAELGINIENIVQQPMDGLVKYHCNPVNIPRNIS